MKKKTDPQKTNAPAEKRGLRAFSSFLIRVGMALIIFAFLFASGTVAKNLYRATLVDRELEEVKDALPRQATANAEAFTVRLASGFTLLNAFAQNITPDDVRDLDALTASLAEKKRNSPFEQIGYAHRDDNARMDNGTHIPISGSAAFRSAYYGNSAAIPWYEYDAPGAKATPCLICFEPVKSRQKVSGLLTATVSEEELTELLDSTMSVLVCSNDGKLLFFNLRSGLEGFDAETTYDTILNGETSEQMLADLSSGRSGLTELELGDDTVTVYYHCYMNPVLSDGGWYVYHLLSHRFVAETVEVENDFTLPAVFGIVFSGIAVLCVLLIERRRRAALEKERASLADSALRLQRNDELLRERIREYRVATEQSEKSVYRIDIDGCSAHRLSDVPDALGLPEDIDELPAGILRYGVIAGESRQAFTDMIDGIFAGQTPLFCFARMRLPGRQRCWYRFDSTTIFDDAGKPVQAVLSYCDVTEQREKELAYERWMQSVANMDDSSSMLVEYNVTTNDYDAINGSLFEPSQRPDGSPDCLSPDFARAVVHPDDVQAFISLLDRENLTALYRAGQLSHELDFRLRQDEGLFKWIHLSVDLVEYPNSSEIKAYILFEDIDAAKRQEISMLARAEKDALTGVLSRLAFTEQAQHLLTSSDGSTNHGFLLIDVDHFKDVNDTFGHQRGDRLLIEVAQKLGSVLRAGDLLGRIGGDEFVICLKDIPYDDVIEQRARTINTLLHSDLGRDISVSASIGISVFPRDGADFEALYRKADLALYRCKENGRNQFAFYAPAKKDAAAPAAPAAAPARSRKSPRRRMLIVDSAGRIFNYLDGLFSDHYEITRTDSCAGALAAIGGSAIISIVIISIDGFEKECYAFLQEMQRNPSSADIPVIVTSGSADTGCCTRAIELGAADCITMPFDPSLTRVRVNNAVTRRELSELRAQNSFLVMRQREEQRHQAELRHISEHDSLTGISNSRTFYTSTQAMLDREPDRQFIMLRFDIERFKLVNDFFGFDEGDRLLCYIADSIKNWVGNTSTFCRITADDFAICTAYTEGCVEEIVERAQRDLDEYDLSFDIALTFGCYLITDRTLPVTGMVDRAALAQNSIKNSPTTNFAFYDESMRLSIIEEQQIINSVSGALANGEFEIYLQPQVDYSTHRLVGAEALARWNHPERGLIPPGDFIPVLEKHGFIFKLDSYIWQSASRIIRRWSEQSEELIPVSVNISRLDIYSDSLTDTLRDLANRSGIPARLLKLEITESAYIDSPQQLIETVKQLQGSGFIVEMDDFGSGYSSLNMLKEITVDTLKIDLRFIAEGGDPLRREKILKHVIGMAHSIGLNVIAEGVETKEQADQLLAMGCRFMQGYYFSKPLPVAEFEKRFLRIG